MRAIFNREEITVTRLTATDIEQIVSHGALDIYCNSSIYFYRDNNFNYYYTLNAGETELQYCGHMEDVECILREFCDESLQG